MGRPLSILFTIPNFITAGSGQAMLNIVERLHPEQFQPAVCVNRKGGALDQRVEDLGIPFLECPVTIPVRPYRSILGRAFETARPFRPFRFDVWHSFHYLDDYTEPIVARFAGAKAWVYTKKNMNWGTRAWWLRSVLARRIAAQNSDMVRQFFSARFFQRKTHFLQRGVDVDRFRPGRRPILRVRDQLGIATGRKIAAIVAHLVPVKGHPTIVAAMAGIPNLHLLIVGKPLDQQYVATLRLDIKNYGIEDRVHFMGAVGDIPALLTEVDVFVLPTTLRGEGCPVALLEAMACGKTCVATDTPGNRDLIVHGESGWLVKPADIKGMQDALKTLLANRQLSERLGHAARSRVEQTFTVEQEVKRHEALYREVASSWR